MRVDFYQLSRDPAETALTQIAVRAGQRMLIVSADAAQLGRISEALWAVKDNFLANGLAGGEHDARQPILLSDRLEAANGARLLALADGQWRDDAESFERVLLLFDGETVDGARATWRMLDGREGMERNYWRQEDGRWVKAA